MNPSFKIETTDRNNTNARLFLELGLQRIVFWIINEHQECTALYSYRLETVAGSDKLAAALKQLAAEEAILQDNFASVTIINSLPVAILVPATYADEALFKPMLELVHGDQNDVFIRNDYMAQEGCYNVYAVGKQMDAVLNYIFPSPRHLHLYSLLPSMMEGVGTILYVIFANGAITAMLKKSGELQAIQTFDFAQPEDVAYHLLNLCESFECPADQVVLHLSGMIDEKSKLFAELYKYFLHTNFAGLPEQYSYPEGIRNNPEHYFSYLFEATRCV